MQHRFHSSWCYADIVIFLQGRARGRGGKRKKGMKNKQWQRCRLHPYVLDAELGNQCHRGCAAAQGQRSLREPSPFCTVLPSAGSSAPCPSPLRWEMLGEGVATVIFSSDCQMGSEGRWDVKRLWMAAIETSPGHSTCNCSWGKY